MTPAQPFALRLFVPSGMPEGMRIVEKSNWSGIGFVVPRSQLRSFSSGRKHNPPVSTCCSDLSPMAAATWLISARPMTLSG